MSAPRRPRALRGAIGVERDTPEAIVAATGELLATLLAANELTRDDVTSACFTATPDLRSEFPAKGARALGWDEVPMLCAQEIDVRGALPRCIRVLLHLHVPADLPLRPVYLGRARALRPDLAPLEALPPA
jgi:chorismate mutase